MVCFRTGCQGGYLNLSGVNLRETCSYSIVKHMSSFVCEFKIQEMYELTQLSFMYNFAADS